MYEYDYCFRKTGSNIRALREAFGETQLDLSLALNFDSSAAISIISVLSYYFFIIFL